MQRSRIIWPERSAHCAGLTGDREGQGEPACLATSSGIEQKKNPDAPANVFLQRLAAELIAADVADLGCTAGRHGKVARTMTPTLALAKQNYKSGFQSAPDEIS